MHQCITRHQANLTGTTSRFDRILFKGRLPLSWREGNEGFLGRPGRRIKDVGPFVNRHFERIKRRTKAMA